MAHLTSDKAKVTWGDESHEFSKAQLEAGINLAAEFTKSPFDKAFAGVMTAVATKQAYETNIIKGMISQFRSFNAEAQKDPELKTLFETLRKKFTTKQSALDSEVHAALVPVKHTLKVTPL